MLPLSETAMMMMMMMMMMMTTMVMMMTWLCIVFVLLVGVQLLSASGSSTFSRRHPLASWVGSMLLCFAGEIFGAGLAGDALLLPLTTCGNCLLTASLVWSVHACIAQSSTVMIVWRSPTS